MIAESPISDARAKSEARRAKILAREAARIRAAKGDTSMVTLHGSPTVSIFATYLLHFVGYDRLRLAHMMPTV